MFKALLKREFLLAWRNKHHSFVLLSFCLLATLLFTIAIGPDRDVLAKVGISLIWVILLFSAQLGSSNILTQDLTDGTLAHIKASHCPLEYYILSKVIVLWVSVIGVIALLLPFLIYSLTLSLLNLKTVLLCFALISLPISFLSLTGASLTIGQNKPSLLASTILTPFYIPLLIFSTSIHTALDEASWFYLWMLGAMTLFMTPILLYINVFTLKWSEL